MLNDPVRIEEPSTMKHTPLLSSSASRQVEAPTEVRQSKEEVKASTAEVSEPPEQESTLEKCLREIKKYVSVLSVTDAQVADSTTEALRQESFNAASANTHASLLSALEQSERER
jgi:hypothetical protein